MCLSLHPFILVDRNLCVHLWSSPLSPWTCLAMEDWSVWGLGGGTWFLGSNKVPTEVVTLYHCFYININIHFSFKFHVQLFIFVSIAIFSLYMFKWSMLVWMLTFNIFYMLGYIYLLLGMNCREQAFDHELNDGLLQTSGWGTVSVPWFLASLIYLAYLRMDVISDVILSIMVHPKP